MSTETIRRVERIAGLTQQTRITIEGKAHSCTWDAEGRCLYCPARRESDGKLMPQGRTGEIK